ncbi:hypothetical protein ThrDRAFT_03387 [Frankia casuarinae]|uniref:Peptidase M23B n=1 Tax=Frankia casuarinae (strain DSM 45818 / CECT 9043 / HFP020203 / CcI3) TaxID=106370 RepID=Q2J9V1_FRACC|nr:MULTISPECIES: hypothetical protein [Frankia]ABD11941.1 hypothetical protein Francci3_2579 [Frankia casuarinae]EYT90983.1 hypothetical protein ThrDRAFT_03387 [Frankia casuarinae]KDA41548.1 hypothetical protein BMG523Draft_03616 [Frankia sp. BMG5.23]ORT48827.1 hypothetical protein KBI5_15240 [Frankia sp. KB5]TFE25497.1 hypothetical protein E0F15_19720 [Frankia sp. B2]
MRTVPQILRSAAAALVGILTFAGVALVAPSAASASTPDPEVWVGAPVAGTWTSDPATHHFLFHDQDQGDWSGDISAAPGAAVKVFVAPQAGGYPVATRVDQIGEACRYGGGGKFVNVGIYVNERRTGSVTYGHLVPAANLAVGQWINRWDSTVGAVATGLPRDAGCWTGEHVHMQSYNVHNYSCFNRGYRLGSPLNPTNFVSFVGGSRGTRQRQACP